MRMFVCFHCDTGECTCGVSSWGIHEAKPPILPGRFRDDLSDDAFNHEMRDDTFPYPPKKRTQIRPNTCPLRPYVWEG